MLIVILIAIIVIGHHEHDVDRHPRAHARDRHAARHRHAARRGCCGCSCSSRFMLGLVATAARARRWGWPSPRGLNAAHIPVPVALQFFLMSRAGPAPGPCPARVLGAIALITGCTTVVALYPLVARRAAAAGRRPCPTSGDTDDDTRTTTLRLAAGAAEPVCPGARGARRSARHAAEMVELLKIVDDRQKNNGDCALARLPRAEGEGQGRHRLRDRCLPALRGSEVHDPLHQAQGVAGKGYLRIDKNLWFYDPTVGKWERRTERERIGGTNSRRSDFDESRLAEEYDPADEGEEKLGAYTAQKLTLKGKPGHRPRLPGASSSGSTRTTRTSSSGRSSRCRAGCCARSYYPKWKKIFSESKKARRLVPGGDPLLRRGREGEQTIVVLKSVDLRPLEANLFTKAWLETKSR